MHILFAFLPVAGYLALEWASSQWGKRPAVRARHAARSLHDKIARQIVTKLIAVSLQAGLIALWIALRLAGILSIGGLIAGTIVSGFYLVVHLYLLRHALAAMRAYNRLGPLAYVAEIRHAFGSLS